MNFLTTREYIIMIMLYRITVEPLLSGHPRGNGNWPLNRGSSEIRIRPFKKVTLSQYKIA